MKSAWVIRHVPFEGLGVYAAVLEQRGYRIRVIEAPLQALAELDPAEPDLLIMLGGPVGAFDDASYPYLIHALRLVQQRIANGRKLLGVCLGAQLIARALGAEVKPMGIKEIGYAPLTLTAAGQQSVLAPLQGAGPVLHWHGDQFQIPVGATHLASSQDCPYQAFSVGNAVLALQFHPEADPRQLEAWLVGHAAELQAAGIDPCTLRAQAAAVSDDLVRLSQQMFADWLDLPVGEGEA
ncbi:MULTISPECIES: glutamine amidotransferase [unclassified Pseudomonas]|uniref:glutamine amidotransferase n=1 Tax=unclassified Pseudomonas TaxID=196821 RepID=UPI0005BB2615|nr:glutamine amidotransferase [Pseudomonas sp. M47T1]